MYLQEAAFAEEGFTVSGIVALPNDRPAARAVVMISSRFGFRREVLADNLGHYTIANLQGGTYQLTASNRADPDQYSDPVEVDLSRSDSKLINVNIFLRNRSLTGPLKGKQGRVLSLAEGTQHIPRFAKKEFDEAAKLRERKRYEPSLKRYGRAIELFPEYFQAFTERGSLLMTLGRLPEAAKDYRRALEINPRWGPALRGAGLCRFQQNRFAEAIQDLQKAADLEPGNGTNYYFMGLAWLGLDRPEQARADLEKALSLDSKAYVRAHVHLASVLIKEKRPEAAAQQLEIYLKAQPHPFDEEKLRALLKKLRDAAQAP